MELLLLYEYNKIILSLVLEHMQFSIHFLWLYLAVLKIMLKAT